MVPPGKMLFLAPLAVGQRAYVMVRCPSSVRAITFSLNIFFAETTYRILMKFHRNVPTMVLFRISNHKAYGYQILHVALSSGPSPRGVNYNPRVELIAMGYKFYIGLYSEILRNFLVAKNKNYGYQF